MFVLTILSLISCRPDTGILAIGDSLLEWNIDQSASIPEVTAEKLGIEVLNNAIGGSYLYSMDGIEIPDQYETGNWDWVLVNGGGNDLNDQCECGECNDIMDNLIDEEGVAGILPDLVNRILSDNAPVILMGYYGMPETASFGFQNCSDEIPIMNARYQALAETNSDVWFIPAGDVVSSEDLSSYDEDHVHPSVKGSTQIGEYHAQNIQDIMDQ